MFFEYLTKNSSQYISLYWDMAGSYNLDDLNNSLIITTILETGRTVRVDEILSELLSMSNEQILMSKVSREGLFIEFGDERITPLDV